MIIGLSKLCFKLIGWGRTRKVTDEGKVPPLYLSIQFKDRTVDTLLRIRHRSDPKRHKHQIGKHMLLILNANLRTFKLGTPIMGGCSSSLLLLLLVILCINPWSFKFLLLLALILMQVELVDSAKLRRDLPAKWFLEEIVEWNEWCYHYQQHIIFQIENLSFQLELLLMIYYQPGCYYYCLSIKHEIIAWLLIYALNCDPDNIFQLRIVVAYYACRTMTWMNNDGIILFCKLEFWTENFSSLLQH